MENVAPSNLSRKIFITALGLILIVVVFFYLRSEPSASTVVQSPIATLDKQAKDNSPQHSTKKALPITPEEKRVVAEREHLSKISAAGKTHINELKAEERRLYLEDQKAQQAIEKLEAQVKEKGLSK